ncbi:hypothetical protein G7Y89_g14240 [Cudoniella acicularis]|uniref:Zn(2)-C6 fungal-type domain-containing protein n=1 Tax=Cudoniella acicularis TaxID=354080 RepID=A0A8H4VWD0_9HELO|nr:hypothetical protein G7Y89_g14240 [Cudoniella acicularis]
MVFPSAACQTCKNRRIKCDETKPTCKRCSKSHRLCLSSAAAKEASFSIHSENRYASGSTNRPRGPRSSLTVIRPRIDVQACAVAYYMQYHMPTCPVIVVPNVSGCLSECVAAWKTSGRTSEIVDLALSSMALAVFSRTQKHREAAAAALSKYQRLLRVSQFWISQVEKAKLDAANMDACLLSIAFMGRFEGIAYGVEKSIDSVQSVPRVNTWHHYDGAMAVLKSWYDDRKHDGSSVSIIVQHIRRVILRTCLMRNQKLPDWLLDGEIFGEHGIELENDRIVIRILALRQAYMRLEHGINAAPAEQLNIAAKEIDKGLQDLADQLPKSCSYQQHIISTSNSFPQRYFLSPIVYSYQKTGYAALWAQHFATRMLINRLRLRILDLSGDSTHIQQRAECYTAIESMGDGLASTIPFCLERFSFDRDKPDSIVLNTSTDITPYLLNSVVWPLTIASGLEGINDRQLSWFRDELAAIGEQIGDRVVERAGASGWTII